MSGADTFHKIPPYGLVRDWLGPEAIERLVSFAQSHEQGFEPTSVLHGEADKIDPTQRVSTKLNPGHLKTELRASLTKLLPAIFDRLGIKAFIPDRIEVELVAHGEGAFFRRHNDVTYAGRHRVVSAVYYFHALPKAFSGGALRLHSLAASGRQGTFVDIWPDYDTLVFFPSFFPHEVLPVTCPSGQFIDSRFAVNFWIHRSSVSG